MDVTQHTTDDLTSPPPPASPPLTPKGSAFSHEMAEPQLAGRNFSGSDSGTATMMKRTSSSATAVAIQMTTVSLYMS